MDELRQRALCLNVEERAALAEELMASLEDLPEAEAQQLWAAESERRLELCKAGRAKGVPSEAVDSKV